MPSPVRPEHVGHTNNHPVTGQISSPAPPMHVQDPASSDAPMSAVPHNRFYGNAANLRMGKM
ncbi:hypothetical protein KIN20_013044 [Parelaphostrongylus tenuis]|uniref:Uncharacterized protein n=1 Tax=Parelaphostrongylus tenuis TaxID=148309 RepID=A0AAD5QQS5_PARTN|nr:hypothetical protein KIN20_013044 [Parelaphostrongylus tenuis]